MPELVEGPTLVQAVGNKQKQIEEFIGRVNTGDAGISIARMVSPSGWEEPGQKPAFTEYTIVLKGTLHVDTRDGGFDVNAGQAVIAEEGDWVKYSTPSPEGAEYVAICIPGFAPEIVNRDT